MPIQFQFDRTRRRVVLTATGRLTIDEWIDVISRVVVEGAWEWPTLCDVTAPGVKLLGPSELATIGRSLADLNSERGQRGPVAFAVGDEVEYHHLKSWGDTVGTRVYRAVGVFRTIAEAERWLDSLPHS